MAVAIVEVLGLGLGCGDIRPGPMCAVRENQDIVGDRVRDIVRVDVGRGALGRVDGVCSAVPHVDRRVLEIWDVFVFQPGFPGEIAADVGQWRAHCVDCKRRSAQNWRLRVLV